MTLYCLLLSQKFVFLCSYNFVFIFFFRPYTTVLYYYKKLTLLELTEQIPQEYKTSTGLLLTDVCDFS